jgi:abhydrolase domain-containing protein 12
LTEFFKSYIAYPFNSISALAVRPSPSSTILTSQKTKCPILILHARDDDVIPHHHSTTLFSGLSDLSNVVSVNYERWGTVSRYERDEGEVLYWDGFRGGHNDIGWAEGSVDLVRRVAGL